MNAFRYVVPSVLGGFALLAVGACSGSDDGGGGSSGTDCNAFAKTLCKRLADCAPTVVSAGYASQAQCAERLALSCEADLAAPGVTATVADLGKCIDAYGATSCDSLFSNETPAACQIAGTRADGEACGADLQCQSQNCNSTGNCGTCRAKSAAGGNCDGNGDCQAGLTCAAGTCATPVAAGGQCTTSSQCAGTLVCKGGTCGTAAGAGQACDNDAPCDVFAGLFCDPASKTCKAVKFVNAGDACGLIDGSYVACGGGGACVGVGATGQGTCAAPAADGQPCDETAGPPCLDPAECVNGSCQLPSPATCG